jgi:hypothetical protein
MLDEDQFWINTLALAFEKQPELATVMAQHLAELQEKLAEGQVEEAIGILNDGIIEIWPYTDFNRASLSLFYRYISKQGLSHNLDPLSIVKDLEEKRRERRAKPQRKKSIKAAKKKRPVLREVKNAA